MEPVRWGILGAARVGGALLHAARGTDAADVVGVASRSAERARAYAESWGIERAHAGYEALLADPGVEAVYVALPNALHVPWTLRALAAGKHALCEKPLARRGADAQGAVTAARRAGLVLAEGFMYRHHPQTRRLAALVREGAVGSVRRVRASFAFAVADGDDPRLRRDLDGGALMDVGCYGVSAARLLLGAEPVEAAGERRPGGDGVDVGLEGVLRFAGGAEARISCAIDAPPAHALEVEGDRGTLRVADPWHGHAPGIELRAPGGAAERVEVEAADPHRLQLEDVSAAVRAGSAPLVGAAEIVGQARAIEALLRSAEEEGGRAVAVAAAQRPGSRRAGGAVDTPPGLC